MTKHVNKQAMLESLPPEWPQDVMPDIRAAVSARSEKIVALDDDPTGTQTVYDTPVLTQWGEDQLRREFDLPAPLVYLLTNSRSLPQSQAVALNTEIGNRLRGAAQASGRPLTVISRSDSTLRGHYPAEVDALGAALGGNFDATFIIPAFFDGGRYTIDDVHYVAEGDTLIPAGETPFARDAAFGYHESNLRAWVAEKSQGRISAEQVSSVSIETIRRGGPDALAEQIKNLPPGSVCVINAASRRDLAVAALGMIRNEAIGKRFLYRTAATFVAVRAGLETRPLLTPADLKLPDSGGGLIVVGSYVPRTTAQLDHLLTHTAIRRVEISTNKLLGDQAQADEIERAVYLAEAALQEGCDVALYTSRELITGSDADSSLHIGQRISDSLVKIARNISVRPRFVLAKGGITSSDIATKGLDVVRASVLGQILPGIPVWQVGEESRHPGLVYIVFPGNVGGEDAITNVLTRLQAAGD